MQLTFEETRESCLPRLIKWKWRGWEGQVGCAEAPLRRHALMHLHAKSVYKCVQCITMEYHRECVAMGTGLAFHYLQDRKVFLSRWQSLLSDQGMEPEGSYLPLQKFDSKRLLKIIQLIFPQISKVFRRTCLGQHICMRFSRPKSCL
jgi:hypothetical protein